MHPVHAASSPAAPHLVLSASGPGPARPHRDETRWRPPPRRCKPRPPRCTAPFAGPDPPLSRQVRPLNPSPLRAGALCDYVKRLTGCDRAQWLATCGWPRRRGGRGAGCRWPAPPLPRMSRRQAPLLAGKLKCNHLLPVILYTLARCHCSWEIIQVVLIGQAVQLNLGVPAVISDYIFVDYTS
jgi:hypothetical protein